MMQHRKLFDLQYFQLFSPIFELTPTFRSFTIEVPKDTNFIREIDWLIDSTKSSRDSVTRLFVDENLSPYFTILFALFFSYLQHTFNFKEDSSLRTLVALLRNHELNKA